MGGGTRVPLTEAALKLELTYHQVRALVLRGELAGGRDEYGHWYVSAAAVRRFLGNGSSKRRSGDRPHRFRGGGHG